MTTDSLVSLLTEDVKLYTVRFFFRLRNRAGSPGHLRGVDYANEQIQLMCMVMLLLMLY